MIKFEKPEVWGWEHAIRGMRNPLNSWERSDSYPAVDCGKCGIIDREGICHPKEHDCTPYDSMVLVSCRTKKGIDSVNRAYYSDGYWHGSGSMSGVVAWMPLPEPYGGKE